MKLVNFDAEQSLLGACMIDPSKMEKFSPEVKPSDFASLEHGIVWQAMLNAWHDGLTPDVVTVSDYLQDNNALNDVGGIAYVAEVCKNTPSAKNADSYARIVLDMARRRRLLDAVANLEGEVRSGTKPLRELVSGFQGHMLEIDQPGSERAKPIADLLPDFLDQIERRWNGEDEPMGLTFGLSDLDRQTYGMQPGDLVLVAGRPSMGKTAFLVNILCAACVEGKNPGVFFSHEMPEQQIRDRMVANLAKIPSEAIRDPREHMRDDYFARMGEAITKLKDAPFIIDDRNGLKVSELRCVAIRWKEHYGRLGWIAVDYLQLLRAESKKDTREREVAEISQRLKALGKELGCPVIALCQLNRALEQRADKRPIMSDLRESGALEQDGDIILFLYRDEVYNEHSQANGTAEIIIGKQREGTVGSVMATAIMSQGRFVDMVKEDQSRIRGLMQNKSFSGNPNDD